MSLRLAQNKQFGGAFAPRCDVHAQSMHEEVYGHSQSPVNPFLHNERGGKIVLGDGVVKHPEHQWANSSVAIAPVTDCDLLGLHRFGEDVFFRELGVSIPDILEVDAAATIGVDNEFLLGDPLMGVEVDAMSRFDKTISVCVTALKN